MTFEARENLIVTNCYRVPADVACAFQDQIRQHMERAQFSRPEVTRPVIKPQPDDLGAAATRMLLTFWRRSDGKFQKLTPADVRTRLGISPQSMANTVRKLHDAGYAEMHRVRNGRLWSLTQEGEAKARRLMGMEGDE